MTFTEHLGELRTRIIRAGIAVVVAVLFCFVFSNQIFEIMARPVKPLQSAATANATGSPTAGEPGAPAEEDPKNKTQWMSLSLFEPVYVKLRLSGYAGLILAFPVVVWQLCAFIFPGLTAAERRVVRFMLLGCGFFVVAGVLVAYFGVLPLIVPYLAKWAPPGVLVNLRMSETISQVLGVLAGFAIAFQFPMAVLVLVYLGLLTPATLKKNRRLAIIILTVAAGILTPPDPASMIIMLIPLVLLYEASIWMSYLVLRKKKTESTDIVPADK
jgi:sec-independent protein translocase protein TatC